MAEEEQDPEKRLRLERIVLELQAATSGKLFSEVQSAFANTVAIMCLSMGVEVADEMFIATQAAMAEVYLAIRSRVRQGEAPKVIN